MSLLNFDEFKWRAMTSAINQLKPVATMIKDLVFPDAMPSASEYIDVDITIGGRKIAPFVSPIQGGVVVEKMREEIRSIRVPRMRLKKPFTANELLTARTPGKGFYATGGSDLNAYRRRKIGMELQDLRNKIDNTTEWMCAEALKGSITYSGENISFLIDYQLPTANAITLTGTDLWSDFTNSDPARDLDAWANLIINALGYGPSIMIMGTDVVTSFRNHTKVLAQLDNRRTEIGGTSWDASSNFIGNYNGIRCFRYGTTYSDLNDATQNFWDPKYIALIAPQARFSVEYANIIDLEAGANVVGKFFSKSWIDKDPSNLWMLVESRPLPVMWEPEAIVYAKVV